jgi:hypothetical protein
MADTDSIIASLTGTLEPVRRLRPPLWRAARLILLALAVIAILVAIRGLRADFDQQMRDPAYWVQVIGAFLTGSTATLAAFQISLPDRSRLWSLLPLPAAALWLYGFAFGCLLHWIAIPAGAPVMEDSERCLTTIVAATIPLALALWLMLRRARPLRAAGTAWLAALAVAGFADTAHLLLHTVQASSLVLVINLVPVAIIIIVGGLGGRFRLNTVAR